ncbi:hypothetical protein LSTR_LSTR009446 [Laodelphax striatellus]|uniref:C2H2-type domain-containing protein n=1 Tax=Laodelphax striatellus TaxID=195883 RepID=A0A482X5U1_LAOST|nr:hypothetical protein LSTR_LSTR009446 [Laodelphax striatellus]
MENFAHTLTTMAAEDQQAANTILMNFDGNQLSVISDVVDGELVTIGNIDGVFENVVVLPNNSTPNASPEKEGGCPTNSPEKPGGPNVFPRGRRDPGTPKPPPTCDLCQKTFSQRKGYSKHMRRIHKVPPKPIEKATEAEKTCNICDKKFLTRAAANLHVLRVHNPLGLSPTYKCTECNYETFNKPLFQRHTIRKHLLKVQKQPKEAVEVACETCGKVFNSKGKLNTHVNNKHFPKRIFECDQCDYKTPTKSAWQRHMVRRHIFRKSERKFKCELCNSSYILERYLKRHMKGVHNVELASSVHKKKCPLCPFVSHKLYRDEMLSHFRDAHAIQITTEKLVFDDMESFVKWRKHVEQTTNSQYRGDYSLEARTKWHNCNRSGHYDYSKAAQLSSVYSTIKLNAFCPSAIHTKRLDNTGRVEVEYWPVHVGHDPNEEDIRKTFVNNLSGNEVPRVTRIVKKKATTTSAREDGVEVMTVEENDEGFVGFEAVEKAATATKAKFNTNYDKLVKETLNNAGATIRPVGKAFNGSTDLPLTYKCGYCSFRTTTQIACQNHVRNHANHVCGLCDFRTTDNAKLKAHHSLKHSSLLKCPHCSKTFLHRRTQEEDDDDEEGEEMVIHCGSLLNSKSADGNSDEEEYNTYEVSDSDNDDGLDIEDVTGVKQLKQTPKLLNEPIQKDGSIVHVDVPVSKISSDAILVVKGKSSTPLKIINKRDIEDNALIKVVEGSQRSADGIRILKVVSGGGDKDQSENTFEGKQLIISKDVKVVKVGNTDKEGVSKQVSNAVLGTTSQTPLKIVDVQSINRRYSFGTEDKKQDNVVISSKAQCTAQVKNVDSQSIRSSPGNVSRTENEKQDIVVSSSKANSTAQVKNVDSQSIRSSPANVSRTEDEKQDIVVISSKAQSTAQVKNVDSQSIRSAQGNESRTEDKKQDKVVISNKVQSTAQVKIVDSKSIRSAQGNVSRTEDKKQDKVVISSKAQSTAQVKNVDSKSIRSSPGNVSRTEDKKQDNVVISSKAQSTAQVKIVDSQSIRSAQGNVSRTEDEKQDNVVISSKAKSLAQVKIVDSKSIRSSPGSVSRTGDKKQDNVVISSKAQCTTQVNNVDSKSIRSSQGNVSRTEEKNQDIVVITDKVQSTSQVPVKIGNSKSIKSSPGNVTRTEDEETDVEVIPVEVTNEETVAGLEEPPPEFEENVIKFVEFCQKKAKSKEQMEYIKKMMQKVMADADL